MYSTN